MTPIAQPNSSTDQLAPYLRALRRRLPLIVLITLVAAGVALALALSATKQYKATAKVFIAQTNPVQNIVGQDNQQPQDPERDLNSKVSLITLPSVADAVKRQLRLTTPTDKLLEQVTTSIEGTSEIVDIDVLDPNPNRAAAIANGFAHAYAANRLAAARGAIQQAAGLARRQLQELPPSQLNGAQGRELADRLRQLEIAAALQTGGIELASPATPPTSAASPRTKLDVVGAGLLGLLLAIGLALAVEAADRRIKEEADVEGTYGHPVLATIPRPQSDDAAAATGDYALTEAFGTLATNLRFFQLGRDVNALLITSPGPREGKTTATLGLARALTDLGLRVVVLDCDLRRPRIANYAHLSASAGLSSILAGVGELDAQLIDVEAATLRPLDHRDPKGTPYFSILPSGPVPPNPQGLLSSAAMREVMRSARAMADVVLVDTAPVGTVSDAVTLAELVDGVAVLVRLKQTRRDVLVRALRVLDHLPTPILGFILTDVKPSSERYYGYGRGEAPPTA